MRCRVFKIGVKSHPIAFSFVTYISFNAHTLVESFHFCCLSNVKQRQMILTSVENVNWNRKFDVIVKKKTSNEIFYTYFQILYISMLFVYYSNFIHTVNAKSIRIEKMFFRKTLFLKSKLYKKLSSEK